MTAGLLNGVVRISLALDISSFVEELQSLSLTVRSNVGS